MSESLVCLDICHGTNNRAKGVYDPGAVANGLQEHVIGAGMVTRLVADIRAAGRFKVMRTEGDVNARDDRARAAGATVFFSLHCNAGSTSASGVEAWMDGHGPKATRFAKDATAGISKTLGIPNRGIKHSEHLAVLHANSEDALLELFFVTSKGDTARYLAHTDDVELVLYNALCSALGLGTVASLPRKKLVPAATPHDEPAYDEIRIHASAIDARSYKAFAAAHGDFCKVIETTKDSWKKW